MHTFFNFKNILVPRVFEKSVDYMVCTYGCYTPWIPPIREVWYPPEGVRYVESFCIGTLWEVASDGSRWVHPDAVNTTPFGSSPSHIITTLQTVEGDVLITVSPYGNGGGCFVVVDDRWFTRCIVWSHYSLPRRLKATCHYYLRPWRFSYENQ